MSLGNIIFTAIVIFSLVCVAVVIFFERKDPASSLIWIMFLIFFPVVGFIAYLFFGAGFHINKKKKYDLKAINDDLYDNYIVNRLDITDTIKFMAEYDHPVRLMTYLKNGGDGVYTEGNSAEVFTDGNDCFPRMIEDIKAAKHHIHLLYFIFRSDKIGSEIAGLLAEKAREGVEVRFLYDSLGSRVLINPPIFRKMKKAGVEVLGFSPVLSNLSSHLRLNYRNHRKITVIDGQIGYVGGMNIGDEYMGKNKKLYPWRDTHLRMTGPSVWFLQERFLMDWGYASDMELHSDATMAKFFPKQKKEGQLGVQIISSGPDTNNESPMKSGLIEQINSARKNVYIQSPYFAPDASFMDAMRIAARSNVDVRLMLPLIGDHWLVHKATLGYALEALKAGIKVYLYNGFIHSKTMVSDGFVASIGTTNITNRSFVLDFEVNAFIYDGEFARKNEQIFLEDQKKSIKIDLDWFKKKNKITLGIYNFARLFAPLI